MRGILRCKLGRFIAEVEKLPYAVTDFDEALRRALVDHITIHSKDNMVFAGTAGWRSRPKAAAATALYFFGGGARFLLRNSKL